MNYYFKPTAIKDLKKLPKAIRIRVLTKINFFACSSAPLKFAKPLKELGSYRFRIGDYRAVFDMENGVLVILTVGHRREIYK